MIAWLLTLALQCGSLYIPADHPAEALSWAAREFKRHDRTDSLLIILLPANVSQVCTEMWRKAEHELVGKHCWAPKTRYEADEWPNFSFENKTIEPTVFAYRDGGDVMIATKVWEAGEDPVSQGEERTP